MSTPQKREVRGSDPVTMVLSFEEAQRWGRDAELRSSVEEQARELGAAQVAVETKGGYRLGMLTLKKGATRPPLETDADEQPRAREHEEEETASHHAHHESPRRRR